MRMLGLWGSKLSLTVSPLTVNGTWLLPDQPGRVYSSGVTVEPLVVVGASTFITVDPTGPFSKFTTLPIQIYQWTSRPQDEFRNIAAAAIIVLLVMVLLINAIAIILRNRYARKW